MNNSKSNNNNMNKWWINYMTNQLYKWLMIINDFEEKHENKENNTENKTPMYGCLFKVK